MWDGFLQRELSAGLDMKDAIQEFRNAAQVATCLHGSRRIDRVLVTNDLQVVRACFLPVHLRVGDHRGIFLDVLPSSLLGKSSLLIQKPEMRKLQC